VSQKCIPLPTVWICFRSKSYVTTLNKIDEKIHKVDYFSQVIIDFRCVYSIFGEVFMFLIGQATVFHVLWTVYDLGFAAGFKCS